LEELLPFLGEASELAGGGVEADVGEMDGVVGSADFEALIGLEDVEDRAQDALFGLCGGCAAGSWDWIVAGRVVEVGGWVRESTLRMKRWWWWCGLEWRMVRAWFLKGVAEASRVRGMIILDCDFRATTSLLLLLLLRVLVLVARHRPGSLNTRDPWVAMTSHSPPSRAFDL